MDSSDLRTDKQHRAVLLILLAASERALEALHVADNPVDETFTTDLERLIARTKQELEALKGESTDAA